ncbi:tetratricopeptide repeat protein [Mucilaginibacter celer]|uniref:Sel1 repeat family protein n=1 Tax=Mucilaginibacter celer TaxID=2305508 RepID=A0A494VXD6_9SPHI|nr:tetratricopeptide repeat protein [Mucilaginibacter celer]AYL98130.1 sel1 repeat family protein [Mucilaginibacter celer]
MKHHIKFLAIKVCLLLVSFGLQAQDLTGTWEAQQNVNNKKYKLSLYLAKTPGGGYVGITLIKEATTFKINTSNFNLNNLSNARVNFKSNVGDKKENALTQTVASFSKGILNYSDLGIIGQATMNVRLDAGSFRYEKSKGKEKLLQNNAPNVEYTKKNNDFPGEYEAYVKDLIEVSGLKFVNSEKTPQIKYNDRGVLSFSVKNNSDYDLQRINLSMTMLETNAEIKGMEGNNGTFSLAKQKGLNPEADLVSGFNLPKDSIHFTVTGAFNNVTLFTKKFSLATIPFFLNDQTTVNKSSDQILSVLKPYYGFDKAMSAPIVTGLNQFALSGNKMAPMWKAIFTVMGQGGYSGDEEAGVALGRKAYKDVLSGARNGDAEAQYLMFYAVGFGLTGDASRNIAGAFLKRSAEAGFLPAVYDYAKYLARDSAYDDSYRYLMIAYNKGLVKAAADIGRFYQMGYSVGKDFSQAIEWYKKGDAFGDPEAMMYLARIYDLNDDDHKADPKKVVLYAAKAANLKNTVAINYLARIYLDGRVGLPRNIPKALALYKEAAALGDNVSMTSLAYLFLDGATGVPKDEKAAFTWAKKAAQAGSAACMPLLAHMYLEGSVTPKDVIISRFWANQARLHGTGDADNTAQQARSNDFMNVLTNIDLSDQHTIYRDTQTGDLYSSNDGPDLLGGIFKSFMGAYKNRRENQQMQINGAKFIYSSGNKKVYGATLSSKVSSNIMLNAGQKIKIASYGRVNFGMIAGIGGPDGIGGFQSYCIDPTMPHGSVMVKVASGWTLAGSNRTLVAPADGVLQFAVNDSDAANNQGYFDIVITVE